VYTQLEAQRKFLMVFITNCAGDSDEDAELNAKYTISVARKIGVPVFITWEVRIFVALEHRVLRTRVK